MSTKPLTPQNDKKNGKKNAAAFAATAAGAAGLGVAGTMMAENHDAATEEVKQEETVATAEDKKEQAATQAHEQTQAHTQAPKATAAAITEEEPETEETTEETEPEQEQEQEQENEEEKTEEPTPEHEEENEDDDEPIIPEPNEPEDNDDVNPDEIAEAIISETEIDPDDIDMAEIINFDDIDTVADIDGQMYTVATFHDASGNEYAMIDVDNDNTFDYIVDKDGYILADEDGRPLETAGITVDDVELDMNPDNTYLAANDQDISDDIDFDDMSQDILQA